MVMALGSELDIFLLQDLTVFFLQLHFFDTFALKLLNQQTRQVSIPFISGAPWGMFWQRRDNAHSIELSATKVQPSAMDCNKRGHGAAPKRQNLEAC